MNKNREGGRSLSLVQKANLPQNPISFCLASLPQQAQFTLQQRGIDVLSPRINKSLSEGLRAHSDLLFHHVAENCIFLDSSQSELAIYLQKRGLQPRYIEKTAQSPYPQDVILNGLQCGAYFIANPKTISREIIEASKKVGKTIVPIRQGYSKCSVAIVSEKAIITSDHGIARSCKHTDLEILLIGPGHIQLTGYPYGLIGGCCGLISKQELAFVGQLETHPESKRISAFCHKHGVEVISLCDGPLQDIGGILPLLEK